MKKTISINISGILFHIEEDGYATLKKYLEAINRHFSHYPDNQEIISDIENRIAEIFLSNLKNNKQVITAENVSRLIEKMGTIADFKADEAVMEEKNEEKKEPENDFYKYITPPGQESKGYKKLTRLENRKILGGVCAGLAHYLSIDPLWTRLVALLLLFSGKLNFGKPGWDFLPWNFDFSLSLGIWALLAYVVLWVILPVSYEEPEDKHVKKLYRNPDDRTLGGVASGLAAYFNIEVIWVRLLFIALIFAGGAGFVIYLILWIITPQAKSITERIQMKGGAITLDNIESTIKENLNPAPPVEESQTRKVLMAPFRFLGKVINKLGEALGPLGKFLVAVIRVFFGLIISFIGIAIIIAPIILLGIYFQAIPIDGSNVMIDNIPAEWIRDILPSWLAIAVGFTILIPGLIILLLGISVILKKSIIEGRFGLIALGVWLLSIGVAGFRIPKVVAQFKTEAIHTEEVNMPLGQGVIVLKSIPTQKEEGVFDLVNLELSGTDGKEVVLVQDFKSRGKGYEDALKNASNLQYGYVVSDSIITFERSLDLSQVEKFRGQSLKLTLEIPYDKPFVMDKSILPIIRNTVNRAGYKTRDVSARNYWVFNEEGLLCLNCSNSRKLSKADSISIAKFQDSFMMK
ncbi:PspC domain-containing protein [Cecembia calidifontis]|jgi:phage shock protein PspC (stress-responsive transcriptional regulator)|uniref:Phage shock protein C (PspC) family protein n=1 Tax=Cecembia calidifontis TaxID=1187080 RepID=A0A4Q7P825_9BACT|nr:PspC domain-containing protein [Cecembia calidifontis]RZS96251.1 phage shock protein C (PspC) family protein [Cecembia calidifontis]